jgi:class 3 adenylate cyclase
VARLVATVPRYTQLDASVVRTSIDGFVGDLFRALAGDESPLHQRMINVSRDRVLQGFTMGDYIRALLLTFPVARELGREVGPAQDASWARSFGELEEVLHRFAATAADVHTAAASRAVEAKNLELNRLNQQLVARERLAHQEAHVASRALAAANEFNQRVLESLTAGVLVVDHATRKVSLYTRRLEEICELPAEQVLGRTAEEAFRPVLGLDIDKLVDTVRELGRIPMRRVVLTGARGRRRTLFMRAERLYGENGQVEGTVVVADDVTERELLMDSFSRYVSRDLLNRVLARGERPGLEGEKQVCTILFADIRGFTTLAEHMAPEALHALLNASLRAMIEGIVDAGGFIDKFVGDKVMALFSSRADVAEAAASALRAAQHIQRRIAEVSEARQARGECEVRVGIGINTGEVLVGNVGSESRMDFTAIGDVVNVADRLQSLAGRGEVLVGEATARLVSGRFPLAEKGSQQVKGRVSPVRYFQLN